ncbi:MAG TPA: protein-L-isoaspartate(D-aspartate) O-methyltransferase [Candidatus Binataceae bacterium]|nr:protein-L-isoaspartate(D-aspartate) O-methyltransferase [Candidatus Binataceae bacterium]
MPVDLTQARERMVVEQLEQRGISDPRVLNAMRTVPRHRFIPPEFAERAYDDCPLPIGDEQTISQPYMVALMTQVAAPGARDRVLEVGTGSGYQAAILAALVAQVYSIERIPSLYDRARRNLQDIGVRNCTLKLDDGSDGWPEEAPFDSIVVTAAMPGIPRPLLEQLGPRGRLVAPIGEDELQTLVRIGRSDGHWQEEYFGECRFVKMSGRHGFSD